MKNLYLIILVGTLLFIGCKKADSKISKTKNDPQYLNFEKIVHADYELYKINNSKNTLVLFPSASDKAKDTRREFNILGKASASGVSMMFMNFNRHLWLDDIQTKKLASDLESAFKENNISLSSVYIGGLSIGGNVALTLSNYLYESNSGLKPQGVFIVDSPIDLYALYTSSVVDTKNPNLNKARLAEPKGIIKYFEKEFGKGDQLLSQLSKLSPYTQRNNTVSIESLAESQLRFYTEPDKEWYKENRQTEFEFTNAYSIQQFVQHLEKDLDWKHVELIETSDKGYRSDGSRNPHSWSIVDTDNLLSWIKANIKIE